MSLYEQFFSDINKEFMLNMANNVLKKDHNITIEGDVDIKEVYLQDMKDIFENNDFVEISQINKELLDLTIKKNKGSVIGMDESNGDEAQARPTTFSGYRKNKDPNNTSSDTRVDDSEKKLAERMKERESISVPLSSEPSVVLEDRGGGTNINDLFKNTMTAPRSPARAEGALERGSIKEETNISDLLKNTPGTKIEELIVEGPSTTQDVEIIDDISHRTSAIHLQGTVQDKDEYVKSLKLVSFTSNKRTSINSSRYNYSVDLIKGGIEPTKLHSLSKVIIPIEDNYIFTLPILTLVIKELDMEVCLQQKDIIKNEYNTMGIYEPIENIIFNISYPLRKLTIDIRDMSNVKFCTNDILKINIMEVKKNIVIFTCSKIDIRNFKTCDMIKIINIQTTDMYILELLSNPLKIKAIKENMIFCRIDGGGGAADDKLFTNIDMKILNISNQNMIYFNQYS
jgi:hypothetical protein